MKNVLFWCLVFFFSPRLSVIRNPNSAESLSLLACILLLLFAPLLSTASTVDSGVNLDKLAATLKAVVVMMLLWHAAAVLSAVVEWVQRLHRLRVQKRDSRADVRDLLHPKLTSSSQLRHPLPPFTGTW